MLGEHEAAIAHHQKALALDQALNNLAIILIALRDNAGALERLELSAN